MDEGRKVYRRFGLAISFVIFVWALVIPTVSHAGSLSTQTHATAGKLTGKVIEVKDGMITMLLNDGAITRVSWAEVSQLAINDRVTISLTSGEKIIGLLNLEGPEAHLNSSTLGRMRLPKENFLAVEREQKGIFPASTPKQPLEIAAIRGRGTQSTAT